MTALLGAGLALVILMVRGSVLAGGAGTLVWFTSAALVALAAVGAVWVGGPSAGPGSVAASGLRRPRSAEIVITPAVLAAGLCLFVQLFESAALQAVLAVISLALFGAVFWAVAQTTTTGRYYSAAQTILGVVAHVAAFIAFSDIYGLKVRSALSATLCAVVAALLFYDLLSREVEWRAATQSNSRVPRGSIVLLAVGGGLVVGELTWGLNYWAALSVLVGGAFLLVAFYAIAGPLLAYVDQRLSGRVALEYAAVGALGALAVFASAFMGQGGLP
jgi:hypothetical protein